MRDYFWSFYNQKNQTRYDGFKTAQARQFVQGVLPEHVADWIVWKEGTPEWLPLSNYKELFVDHSDFTYAAESEFNLVDDTKTGIDEDGNRLENANTFTNSKDFEPTLEEKVKQLDRKIEETSTNILGGLVPEDYIDIENMDGNEAEDISLKLDIEGNSPKPELRKNTRYRHQLDAEVDFGGGKLTKTKTLDISTGGVLLEMVMPEDSPRNIKMKLKRGMDTLEVLCQNLPDRNGKPSRRYRFLSVSNMDLLKHILVQR